MKVSVLMITYNHEQFIAQAIDSVLMQQVDFDYEIVVGEDCSTDSTREILLGYQEKNSDRIRLILTEKNIGMHENFLRTLKACQGEYIALIEGDDYWVSRQKLQKQATLLDNHADYSSCFHNADVISNSGKKLFLESTSQEEEKVFQLEDLLTGNIMPTASVMFRNGIIKDFPSWFFELKMIDWPLNILNSQHGKVGYIDEVMSVYRIHSGGVWSQTQLSKQLLESIKLYIFLANHLGDRYRKIIDENLSNHERQLSALYLENQEIKSSRSYLNKCLNWHFRSRKFPGRGLLLHATKVYLFSAYELLKIL